MARWIGGQIDRQIDRQTQIDRYRPEQIDRPIGEDKIRKDKVRQLDGQMDRWIDT